MSFPRRAPALLIAGALVAAGLFMLPPLLGAFNLWQARNAFLEGIALTQSFEIKEAREAFARGGRLAASGEQRIDSPLVGLVQKLPGIGADVDVVLALSQGATNLAPAALQALKVADAFPRGPDGPELGFQDGRLDLAPWPQAAADLDRAAEMMRSALSEVENSQRALLPPVRKAQSQFLEQGEQAVATMDTARDAIGLIPHFFGAGQPRTWLLLIQNPSEMRGTGGFLGAFAILRADEGKLELEQFASNEALPEITTPAPAPRSFAEHYDRFGARTFWPNANMSPDFPAVAQLMAGMWKQGTGNDIDGVMAIDAVGLNHLLGLVGSIDVPTMGEVDSGNFLQFALNEAYIRFEAREDRSRVLLDVGMGVWSRILAGNIPDLRDQVGTFDQMLATKRLQIWSPEKQDVLESLGVGGELDPSPEADFLMVVGNNAGGNKLDYYARRRISYNVDIGRQLEYRADLEVQIKNTAPSTGLPGYILGIHPDVYPPGLLPSYTSVYMPEGATDPSATVNSRAIEDLDWHFEQGLQAASSYVRVPSRSAATLALSTQRRLAEPGEYRLVVQQQPSLHPDKLELQIRVPSGWEINQVTDGMVVDDNTVTWKGYLTREREFLVRYELPTRSGL